jgi:3-phenylpropionate/cinnamic acid dioxygenase small subunit
MDSRSEIENLLAKYCRLYDEGDLDGYADLFRHGSISGMRTPAEIVAWHRRNVIYYDGSPKVRHVISNLELEIDDTSGFASGRCYVVVYQALPDFPLQALLIGSYRDKFRRIDGRWHFIDRQFDRHLTGNYSRHAKPAAKLPSEA